MKVRRGYSRARDEAVVAGELAAQCASPDAAIALVFAASSYDADRLASELARAFAPVPVVGCTTAGEIGPSGFVSDSAVAMTLSHPSLRVGIAWAGQLQSHAYCSGGNAGREAREALGDAFDPERCVALSIIDGRSGQEEVFLAGAASKLAGTRLVGGSASDMLDGTPMTRIFHRGEARGDCGLLVVIACDVPMLALKSEHMLPDDRRVVVTDVEGRLVRELDGKPATVVYRELVGVEDGAIDRAQAAQRPFAQYVGGQPYVRSVLAVEGDALRFACAVDKGVVLRPMSPGDLVAKTAADLQDASAALGGISAVVAFSCNGRFLEAEVTGTTGALGELLAGYPVIGFNTFGEQFNAMHVNHTLTALVFGIGGGGG